MSLEIGSQIARVIGDPLLARDIYRSIQVGLKSPNVHLSGGKNVLSIFKTSLDAAIRDIENHRSGILFQRLIEFGPHNPDDPAAPTSNGKTRLSDPECVIAVEFIFSHMVNRFKGELAELLAIEPTLKLVEELQKSGTLPGDLHIYFGDTIQERRVVDSPSTIHKKRWGSFSKGADGLIAHQLSSHENKRLAICGLIEVKSMRRSAKQLENQLNHHLKRLSGGVRLAGKEFTRDAFDIGLANGIKRSHFKPIFITVIPSSWKLTREWHWEQDGERRRMVFPDPTEPIEPSRSDKASSHHWRIKLAWSQEALAQAAYEMTFWYMSQVGKVIYPKKPLPRDRKEMTPAEVGYNDIKMMLYYIPLRIKYYDVPGLKKLQLRKKRQAIDRKASRLYNVYCFGYPLGVASKEMLWPEDLDSSKQE